MCGIVGYIGQRQAQPVLLEGLKRLEYRGYDSAGMATIVNDKVLVRKQKGKVAVLTRLLNKRPLKGNIGISHCLHPETLICLADGRIVPISDVEDNDEVIVTGLKTLKCRNGGIVKVFSHPSPPFLYQVKTPYFNFRCTGQHSVFAGGADGMVCKKAVKDIKDELIAMPKILPHSRGSSHPLKAVEQETHYLLTSKTREFLKRARLKKGLSLAEATRRAEVGRLYMKRLERGLRRSAEDKRLRRILNIYDVPDAISLFNLCNFKTNNINLPLYTNRDLMQIIGYHTGDGFAWRRMLRYKDANKGIADFYKDLYIKVFGLKKIVLHKRENHYMFRVNSKFLVGWFMENFGQSFWLSKDKDLPSFLNTLPEEEVTAFLRGLYDAEGCVGLGAKQLCLRMTAQKVVKNTQFLLLRFGILATYNQTKRRNKRWRTTHALLISDRESLRNFYERIGFSSAEKQKRLLELINNMKGLTTKHFPTPVRFKTIMPYLKKYKVREKTTNPNQRITGFRLEKIIRALRDKAQHKYDPQLQAIIENIEKFIHSDIVWVSPKIEKIPSDTDKVYDLELDSYHNFIGNGILQHNSRWATHGVPSQRNAHPHTDCEEKIAIVHNGIIENYELLKEQLKKEGHIFKSETDTEVIVHLIEKFYKDDIEPAVRAGLKLLKGSFALGIISSYHPDKLIAARFGSPLVVGLGSGENYIASDIPALLKFTKDVIFIEDNEMVVLTPDSINITNLDGKRIKRSSVKITWDVSQAEKEGFRHFMLKEIHEQPSVLEGILNHRVSKRQDSIYFEELSIPDEKLLQVKNISIIACGTAYHAGFTGKYILEDLIGIPVEIDVSSEFRYRNPAIGKDTLAIAISQSGETADTIASIREAKRRGAKVLSIVNVLGSTITRESDGVIYTHAGPEIGVASTKAYTAQLCILYLFGIYFTLLKKRMSRQKAKALLSEMAKLPQAAAKVLKDQRTILGISSRHYDKKCFLYLARNLNFPNALEGALKLKEISYVHAEGYGAGEMKHGPIALIDKTMPVVCIATASSVYDKMVSNIQEIKARGGIVISIATEGDEHIKELSDYVVYIPRINELFSPILTVLPLQLLAYHIAVKNRRNVDQPRNLAKSVTVE